MRRGGARAVQVCVLPHRQRALLQISFHPMSAKDNMQDAIQQSKSEHGAKGTVTDRLEPSRRGQEHYGPT